MINYNKIAVTTLFYSLFIVAVIFLIFDIQSDLAITMLIWFVSSFVLFWIIDKRGIHHQYKLLIVISVWLHVFGMLYFYQSFQYYDKVLHFVISYAITMIVYDYFVKNLHFRPKKLMVFLSALGIGVVWEMIEYFNDVFLGNTSQGVFSSTGVMLMSPISDTMIDLIVGGLGAILYLAFKDGEVI